MCDGMQKYGEIFTHRRIALRQHGFGRATDHHVVRIAVRLAEQLITHSAADTINTWLRERWGVIVLAHGWGNPYQWVVVGMADVS